LTLEGWQITFNAIASVKLITKIPQIGATVALKSCTNFTEMDHPNQISASGQTAPATGLTEAHLEQLCPDPLPQAPNSPSSFNSTATSPEPHILEGNQAPEDNGDAASLVDIDGLQDSKQRREALAL
jgi:hypothetical protein